MLNGLQVFHEKWVHLPEATTTTSVRHHLEYASPLWDARMDNHITQKKALQQQSAHFVKNGWKQTPGAVPNLLNDLDWPSLQHGRKNINVFILPFYQYKGFYNDYKNNNY